MASCDSNAEQVKKSVTFFPKKIDIIFFYEMKQDSTRYLICLSFCYSTITKECQLQRVIRKQLVSQCIVADVFLKSGMDLKYLKFLTINSVIQTRIIAIVNIV